MLKHFALTLLRRKPLPENESVLFCLRIIFVCTFLFSLFVFLFSSHRIIFEIKNKKERIKVAVEFFKAPNENAKSVLRLLSCEENCSKKSG